MLDFMRRHAKSWFVTIIIGAIVVVFVLWGIGTFRSAQFQKVVEVNGVKIYLPEYYRAYQTLVRSYQERLGGDFTEEVATSLNLKEQTLNHLIDEILIRQAAQSQGLMVTDAELRDYIQRNPAFADGRGFNEKRYFQLLARQRLPASEYEAMERQRLLNQKMVGFITAFAKVSEADLQETYRLEHEAVRVDYVVIGPSGFLKQQQVDAAEVERFYESHKELFREPEKVRFRYVFLKYRDKEPDLKPDRQKLEAFYYDHLEDFSQAETIRVNEIVIEIHPQAKPAERERLQQQAQALLQRARAGERLDRLAAQHAQSPGFTIKGPEVQVVKRGQKSSDWEAVAFKLARGETGLATTPAGFHILQVIDIQETKTPDFASILPQVEKSWREAEAVHMTQQQAARLRGEMLSSSFAVAVGQAGLPMQETPLLTAVEAIPGLGLQPAVSQAAWKLKPQEIGKPVTLEDGVALFQLVERQESVLPPLDQIKDRVAEAVRLEKAKEAAAREAKKALARLQKGETLAKLAAQLGLPLRDSGFFTRPQGFPGHPQARSLTTAAFALNPAQPHLAEPIRLNGDNFLLALKARRQPDPKQFAQDREQMEKYLLELKQQMVFSQWLALQRQRAKIRVYELPS
ncbi:MAG: hypothetical protein FJ135_13745 [Deltaproteobacteria bacterium]|nr:hypothetical protein [Deltaproteobacteria bacterium]